MEIKINYISEVKVFFFFWENVDKPLKLDKNDQKYNHH